MARRTGTRELALRVPFVSGYLYGRCRNYLGKRIATIADKQYFITSTEAHTQSLMLPTLDYQSQVTTKKELLHLKARFDDVTGSDPVPTKDRNVVRPPKIDAIDGEEHLDNTHTDDRQEEFVHGS